MKVNKWFWMALLGLCTINMAYALAPLSSKMEAYQIVRDKDGKESRVPAQTVAPGGVVEYQLTYMNQSKDEIKGLKVTGPIPKGAVYVADSAKAVYGTTVEASLDKGASWQKVPVMREALGADGKKKMVAVPVQEYQQIRWVGAQNLAVDKSQVYTYRVKILPLK